MIKQGKRGIEGLLSETVRINNQVCKVIEASKCTRSRVEVMKLVDKP